MALELDAVFAVPEIDQYSPDDEIIRQAEQVCALSTAKKTRRNLRIFHKGLCELGLCDEQIRPRFDNFHYHIIPGFRILQENTVGESVNTQQERRVYSAHDAIEDLPSNDALAELEPGDFADIDLTFTELLKFFQIDIDGNIEANREGFVSLLAVLICTKDPKVETPKKQPSHRAASPKLPKQNDEDDQILLNSFSLMLRPNSHSVLFNPDGVEVLRDQVRRRVGMYKLIDVEGNPDLQQFIDQGLDSLDEDDFLLAFSIARKVKLTDRLQSLSQDLEVWKGAKAISGDSYLSPEYKFGIVEALDYVEKTEILLRKMYADRDPIYMDGMFGVDDTEINLHTQLIDVMDQLKELELDLLSNYSEQVGESRSGHNQQIIDILMQKAGFSKEVPYQVRYLVALHDLIQHTIEAIESEGGDLSTLIVRLEREHPRIFTKARLKSAHMNFALAAMISANGVEQESEVWRALLSGSDALTGQLVDVYFEDSRDDIFKSIPFFRYKHGILVNLRKRLARRHKGSGQRPDREEVESELVKMTGWNSFIERANGVIDARIDRLVSIYGVDQAEAQGLYEFVQGIASKSSDLDYQRYSKYLRGIELPAIDIDTMIEIAKFYDIESIVVKAAEAIVNVNKPVEGEKGIGTLWRDVQELVIYYAPLLKLIGFDDFSKYCYEVAYEHIYVRGFGDQQLPRETEEIQKLVDAYQAQMEFAQTLYPAMADVIREEIIQGDMGYWIIDNEPRHDVQDTFLESFANPGNFRFRIKSLGSFVKKCMSPKYSEQVDRSVPDLFGFKLIMPDYFCDNRVTGRWDIEKIVDFSTHLYQLVQDKFAGILEQGHTKDSHSIEIYWGSFSGESRVQDGIPVSLKGRKGSNYQAVHLNFRLPCPPYNIGIEFQLLTQLTQALKFVDDGIYKAFGNIRRVNGTVVEREMNSRTQQRLAEEVAKIRSRVIHGLFNPHLGSRLVIVSSSLRDYLRSIGIDITNRSTDVYKETFFNIADTETADSAGFDSPGLRPTYRLQLEP